MGEGGLGALLWHEAQAKQINSPPQHQRSASALHFSEPPPLASPRFFIVTRSARPEYQQRHHFLTVAPLICPPSPR